MSFYYTLYCYVIVIVVLYLLLMVGKLHVTYGEYNLTFVGDDLLLFYQFFQKPNGFQEETE